MRNKRISEYKSKVFTEETLGQYG